ncbi:MAG: hypothetical protein KAI64_04000, partial [Thermoplasmata archaeon]|nr:hypothetical protein [Thermoplasmata archaeon]
MFCVECGREGKVFEALCPSCFLERKKLIELPKTFDIVQCSTCDSLLLDKKWQKAELEPAIDRSISSSLWHNPILKVQELRQEKQFEDRSNITDKITVVLDLDGTEKEIHHSIRVRLKSGTCPSCSKRLGGYYEAIIQVRPTSKSFTGDLLTEVRDH